MTFHVKTTVFEGPLDLLLQLITKHQVEITAVGLTGVVGEYLSFLDEMRDLDLEDTSEFLLIAATLIQLKAHSLLPKSGDIDMDEELELIEERDRLLSRLLISVTFKDVAAVLLSRMQNGNRYVPRNSGLDQKITISNPNRMASSAQSSFTMPTPRSDPILRPQYDGPLLRRRRCSHVRRPNQTSTILILSSQVSRRPSKS